MCDRPLYTPNPVNSTPESFTTKIGIKQWHGRALWEKVSGFHELTHNYRCVPAPNGTVPVLAQFLQTARVGKPDLTLLKHINRKCHLFGNNNENADPRALWMAPTKDKVQTFNDEAFQRLDNTHAPKYRSIADHVFAKCQTPTLSDGTKRNITSALFKVSANKNQSDFNGEMLLAGNESNTL